MGNPEVRNADPIDFEVKSYTKIPNGYLFLIFTLVKLGNVFIQNNLEPYACSRSIVLPKTELNKCMFPSEFYPNVLTRRFTQLAKKKKKKHCAKS